FELPGNKAVALLTASTHLLGRGDDLHGNVAGVLAPSLEGFSRSQADSALEMMEQARRFSPEAADLKAELIKQARAAFGQRFGERGKWD
ncbi:MAG: hypothetical protein AAFU65_00810, partial [Pseudomonadota bacterium]